MALFKDIYEKLSAGVLSGEKEEEYQWWKQDVRVGGTLLRGQATALSKERLTVFLSRVGM